MIQAAFVNWLITAVILRGAAFRLRDVKFGWVRAFAAALIAQILIVGYALGAMFSAPSLNKGWIGFALNAAVPVAALALGIGAVRGITGAKRVVLTAAVTWLIFQGVVLAITSVRRHL